MTSHPPEEQHKPQPHDVSAATVARLPLYLRVLTDAIEEDSPSVSSEDLADLTGVGSAVVRRDMSSLRITGTRGVGYPVTDLRAQLADFLGLTTTWPVIIIGAGRLGQALMNYPGFGARNFDVVRLFDVNHLVGTTILGRAVEHSDTLEEFLEGRRDVIVVLAVPAAACQAVCDRVVRAGVRSILNFAPVVLDVPPEVNVRKVDLSSELQILAFHARSGRHDVTARPTPREGAVAPDAWEFSA